MTFALGLWIGATFGCIVGVALMCLLFMSRDPNDKS